MNRLDRLYSMGKKILIVRAIVLITGIAFIIAFMGGCLSFTVNQEKDLDTVVVRVGDKDYLKKDFLRYNDCYLFYLEASGSPVAEDAATRAYFKTQTFAQYWLNLAVREDMKDLEGVTVPDDARESFDKFLEEAASHYDSPEAYQEAVAAAFGSEEEMTSAMLEFFELDAWGYAFTDSAAPCASAMREETVLIVDGVPVKRSLVYFFVLYNALYATADDSASAIIKTSAQQIAQGVIYQKLLEDSGITLTEEEIADAVSDLTGIEETYESVLVDWRKAYYQDEESYRVGKEFLGRSIAAGEKMQDVFKLSTPTDKALKDFYTANPDFFRYSTVAWVKIPGGEEAAEALERAREGRVAFDAMLDEYGKSEDYETGGFEERGADDMDAELAAYVFTAKKGEASLFTTANLDHYIVFVDSAESFTPDSDKERSIQIYRDSDDAYSVYMNDRILGAKIKEQGYDVAPQTAAQKVLVSKHSVKNWSDAALR